MSNTTRQSRLASRPEGTPTRENFEMVERPVESPGPNEVVVRTLYLSVDPYMRARMSDLVDRVRPWEIGEVLRAQAIGEVTESNHRAYEPGDVVSGHLDWADYSVTGGHRLTPVDPDPGPISTALGVRGIPGQTAYFGLLDVAEVKPGETVVLSAAAGATGSVAGQIAGLMDCRVVGIAGSDTKTEFLKEELGFDVGINYTDTDDMAARISDACPGGVDVYFDNVGGWITDGVLENLAEEARVAVCGQVALYNRTDEPSGPRHFMTILENDARVEAILIEKYQDQLESAIEKLDRWVAEDKIQHRQTIVEGLERAPEAFIGLFDGENIGKQLVKVGEL